MAGRPPLPSASSMAVKDFPVKRRYGRAWRLPPPPPPPPPPLHELPYLEITIDGQTITKLPPRKKEDSREHLPDPYGFESCHPPEPEEDNTTETFIYDKSDKTGRRGWLVTVTPAYRRWTVFHELNERLVSLMMYYPLSPPASKYHDPH